MDTKQLLFINGHPNTEEIQVAYVVMLAYIPPNASARFKSETQQALAGLRDKLARETDIEPQEIQDAAEEKALVLRTAPGSLGNVRPAIKV